jgi:8-oxo-dGTP pyrophosphatase MutT (NUDIX family)
MEKVIKKINDSDIWLSFESFESKMHYAWKAIVIDHEHNIAIIHSKKYWWYELPWWHIDPWEDEIKAVIRECKEEIWCDVTIQQKIWIIIEERYWEKYKKTSHYFLCNIIGEKGLPQLMESEIDEDLETLWISIDTLKSIFNTDDSNNIERRFVQMRDKYVIERFLETQQ